MACLRWQALPAKMLRLPSHRNISEMRRDQARSDAMAQALLQAAKSLGFGPRYEGKGLPYKEIWMTFHFAISGRRV